MFLYLFLYLKSNRYHAFYLRGESKRPVTQNKMIKNVWIAEKSEFAAEHKQQVDYMLGILIPCAILPCMSVRGCAFAPSNFELSKMSVNHTIRIHHREDKVYSWSVWHSLKSNVFIIISVLGLHCFFSISLIKSTASFSSCKKKCIHRAIYNSFWTNILTAVEEESLDYILYLQMTEICSRPLSNLATNL